MSENGIFQLGTFSVRPGEKASGFLSVADGEFQLPVTILNGEEPGKTVLITAGIHAGEYVGIQAAVELADRLKTEKIAGTVVIVKVINREAQPGIPWKQGGNPDGAAGLGNRKGTFSYSRLLY